MRIRRLEPLVHLALLLAALIACGGKKSSTGNAAAGGDTPAEAAVSVDATTLMADYKANEVRGDGKWKGKLVSVTGVVGDIKKDILDKPYVTLGSGAEFEIPQVQCSLASGQESAAANLSKGTRATFKGRVKGLMLNVHLEDCEFAPGSRPAAAQAAQPQQPARPGMPAPAPRPAAPPLPGKTRH